MHFYFRSVYNRDITLPLHCAINISEHLFKLSIRAEPYARDTSHAFNFHWKKSKYNDVIFAGVCTEQSYSLMSGEYDL